MGIASIVIGAKKPGSCDYEDEMGLDVGQYLIGSGIASIIISFILFSIQLSMLMGNISKSLFASSTFFSILSAIFGTAWFIVGAIILFRGNIDCIREGSAHVIYALVIWCLSALGILHDVHKARETNAN